MSLLSRVARSRTLSARKVGTGCDGDQPGCYLTDGINLYRHLGAMPSGMSQMVGLENGRTLDVMLLPIGELHARRLRPVMPSRIG